MIALQVLLTVLIILGVVYLYKYRYKYPILERSYMLCIYMCLCFYYISIYYPITYMLIKYSPINYEHKLMILKFIYLISNFVLYLSYFSRSFRIYGAFTGKITKYFDWIN